MTQEENPRSSFPGPPCTQVRGPCSRSFSGGHPHVVRVVAANPTDRAL